MTTLEFQKNLAEEIKKILSEIITKNADGEKRVGVSVYRQFLPKVLEDDEDESKFYPFAIVRLDKGITEDDFEAWQVSVDILLGLFDDDPETDGNDQIMILIQRIVNRFSQEARLAPNYTCERQMEWACQDEDTYPYYFGVVSLKFRVPKLGRSEPIYGRQKTGRDSYEGYC